MNLIQLFNSTADCCPGCGDSGGPVRTRCLEYHSDFSLRRICIALSSRLRPTGSAAAPSEVEREIINRQEEALKGLEGLKRMGASAEDNLGQYRAGIRYIAEYGQGAAACFRTGCPGSMVTPDEADEPTLKTSGADDNAIAWFRLSRLPGNDRQIHTFGDFAEDVVKERIERVAGVGRVDVYGGGDRELQVIVNPEKMARYNLTVSDIVNRLRAANASVSGAMFWKANVDTSSVPTMNSKRPRMSGLLWSVLTIRRAARRPDG